VNAITRHHVVIYTGDEPPALLLGESEELLDRMPICVHPSKHSYHLEPASRVCLSRPYPVEHDIPVMEYGKVADEHISHLIAWYENVQGSVGGGSSNA